MQLFLDLNTLSHFRRKIKSNEGSQANLDIDRPPWNADRCAKMYAKDLEIWRGTSSWDWYKNGLDGLLEHNPMQAATQKARTSFGLISNTKK